MHEMRSSAFPHVLPVGAHCFEPGDPAAYNPRGLDGSDGLANKQGCVRATTKRDLASSLLCDNQEKPRDQPESRTNHAPTQNSSCQEQLPARAPSKPRRLQ